MNEWGLPNWRDASAYGAVEQWDIDRWRWEFFRRRQDLREFFDRSAENTKRRDSRAHESKEIDSPGFLAVTNDGEEQSGLELFGYNGVPNPRIGNQPKLAITPWEKVFPARKFIDPNKIRPTNHGEMSVIRKPKWNKFQIALDPHELAIKFDLDKPLAEQLAEAKGVLERKQIKRHGSKIQRRKHTQKWLGYLRVLDAREADVPWSQITDLFHAQGLLSRRKDPQGGYCAPPPQAARDLWDQARVLCFNF